MGILKLNLGMPERNWLPVRLETPAGALEFWASAILANPVYDLAVALGAAADGRDALSWWWLEPQAYGFELLPRQEQVTLRVLHSQEYLRNPGNQITEVESVTGTRSQILLPLWRGLRQFEALEISPTDWPETHLPFLPAIRQSLGDFHS